MEILGMGAIVTGGASGLGAATARNLAANGARVTIFDLDPERGSALATEIGGLFSPVDVSDERSVADGIARAEARHGIARILVNCAGICPAARTIGKDGQPHSMDVYRRAIEVNLVGTFNMVTKVAARAASAEELDGERGVIINTASVSGYEGQIGQAAYSASKGGVIGMTLPIARDLASHKIRVMAIAPGVFLTPMIEAMPMDRQDALGAQVPHPSRLGKPEEYGRLVEAIIRNPMLNGEVIRLDGAIRMSPR